MVAQLDQMQGTTPAPVYPTPRSSSYVIGPLDPRQITAYQALLSTGREITLLVPKLLPLSVLTGQAFKAGMEEGYLECELDDLTVPQMANEIYKTLSLEAFYAEKDATDPDPCLWIVGFVVGALASVAGTSKTLARTGLAHLSFLLSFFPLDPLSWPSVPAYMDMGALHHTAVRAYRADFSHYRRLGKSYREAQRLTLVASKRRMAYAR